MCSSVSCLGRNEHISIKSRHVLLNLEIKQSSETDSIIILYKQTGSILVPKFIQAVWEEADNHTK